MGRGVDRAAADSAKDFADFLQVDIVRWTKLVRELGLKAE